ncbi:MAG: tetratricopeptide repeat protein, partial [Candidatus Eisenbacteria bacterium]
FLIAAALAAALLYMILGPHRIGDYMAETDFYGAYAEGARLVQQGRLLPSRYGVIGPGYEVILGLVGFVIPNLFLAAGFLSLAATLTTLGLWFAIIRRLLDARVALAAAALFAVNTFVFRYGYSATTDAVAGALQAGALYLLLVRGSPRAMLGAGLLAAAAFLTRYNAIYLLPAGLIAIAARATAGAASAARAAKAATAEPTGAAPMNGLASPGRVALSIRFLAGFLAPVVPWVIFSLTRGSSFSFQLHHNVAYEVFARARGIPWDNYQKFLQPQFHNLWDVIARDPGAVASRMLLNVAEHLRDDGLKLMGGLTAAAAACGALIFAFDRRARPLWPVLVAGALLFLTLVPAFHSERYSLALMPIYAALGGLAFGSPRFAVPLRGIWLKAALIAVPLFFAVRANIRHQAYAITQLPVEVLEIAETLRQLKRPGDRVIARKPHVAFHAGVEPAPFPFADTLPGLADDARKLGARWLFFSWPEAETRPAFWHLLDTAGVVPGLTVRRVTRPHPAVLYEIGPEFGRTPDWFANDTLRAWHQMRARTLVDAHNAALFAGRGALERALGRHAEARTSLQRALAIDPNHLDALIELGAIGYQTGDMNLSVEALERASRLHPESALARIGLGWAYLQVGREREAAMVWRPAVTSTTDPATLRRMREVFQSTGDSQSAAEAAAGMARLGIR